MRVSLMAAAVAASILAGTVAASAGQQVDAWVATSDSMTGLIAQGYRLVSVVRDTPPPGMPATAYTITAGQPLRYILANGKSGAVARCSTAPGDMVVGPCQLLSPGAAGK